MGNSANIINDKVTKKLDHSSKILRNCVLILGILVLVGWQFNIDFLKSPLPNMVAMNPMTAVGFVVTYLSFLVLNKTGHSTYLFFLLGIIPLAIGLLKLGDTLFHVESNVDQILFADKLSFHQPGDIPNRMAPNSACNFVLTGLALLSIKLEANKRKIPSQYIALMIAFISLLSIIGYIYHVKTFYGVLSYIPMALHTAIGFLMISLVILFYKPNHGFMLILTSDYEGSNTARLLIPAAILTPVLLGYLRLLGQWNEIYSVEFGGALLIVTIIVAFIGLIWYNSNVLNERDKLRRDTEHRIHELNEELMQINSKLISVNNDLEAFSYSVSHDLKSPLRAVISFASIVDEDYSKVLDEDGRNMLQIVITSGKKMNNLIDDLLAFSKIERTEIQKDEIDTKQLVENIWDELSHAIPHCAQLKTLQMHNLYADNALLRQVMVNLLSNAIKYSAKSVKPSITINSEIKGDDVIYSIADNGVGFDMKYAQKLFGVFQRLHGSTDFEGTGVGLAIVQRIINKHQGRVWADAELGKGATFYFALPKLQK
ncbi:MAG TPA: ATP-binding protein [Cyclobacteriaceae bacterium]|nr:ATP-binding protein [Cyclobacteriaceae bacterium]